MSGATTWADALQAYSHEKCNDGPQGAPIQRCLRRDGGSHKRNAREFDIVSLTPKELPPAAAAMQQSVPSSIASRRNKNVEPAQTRESMAEHVNHARQAQMQKAHHVYDIITMTPLYGVPDKEVTAAGGNQEPRGKRIEQKSLPPIDVITNQPPPGMPEPPMPVLARGRKKHEKDVRPTNIISHRYVADPQGDKVQRDAEAYSQAIGNRVLEGRTFNPITQQYNDAAQEADARRATIEKERNRVEHVKNHTYKTSGIVKRSEGHAYDIVTCNVYNPGMVLALDKQHTTGLLQRSSLRQHWEHNRDAEEAVRMADAARSLNRISQKRLLETTNGRGYNILANSESRDDPIVPIVVKEPSAYDILKASMKPKTVATTDLLRADGPRSTHERVFHVPSSDVNAAASTFDGRRSLLLPTLDRAAGKPRTAPR